MITRVRIKNFRAIRECDVELQPLTFLVGPNGSGKSSFLDALAFVSDALEHDVDQACRMRGGIEALFHNCDLHSMIWFEFEFKVKDDDGNISEYRYGLQIEYSPSGPHPLTEGLEDLKSHKRIFLRVGDQLLENPDGQNKRSDRRRKIYNDRLALPMGWGPEGTINPFVDYYNFPKTCVYNLSPSELVGPRPTSSHDILTPTGANIASVWRMMKLNKKADVLRRMKAISPHLSNISVHNVGGLEFLEFTFAPEHVPPYGLPSSNVSTGTLNLLGVLMAISQSEGAGMLVGIEEPEISLYPPVLSTMLDALFEASQDRQIIVSTHSPDLLDDQAVRPEQVLHTSVVGGEAVIRPIEEAAEAAIKREDFTVGELLRMGQLERSVSNLPGYQPEE